MFTKPFASLLLSLAVGLFVPAPATAQIILNGGFESQPNFGAGVAGDAGYSALTGNQIPGWIIEPGHAVSVHNTVLYPTISGAFSVNLDGEGFNGHNGNLYQDFAASSGAPYQLEFDWMGWMNTTSAQLNVSLTDTVNSAVLFNGLYSFDTAFLIHHITTPFVGTGNPLRLRIQESPESTFNDNAFMVDNFSVTAVPEPGSLSLLGVAALLARPFTSRPWRGRLYAFLRS